MRGVRGAGSGSWKTTLTMKPVMTGWKFRVAFELVVIGLLWLVAAHACDQGPQ